MFILNFANNPQPAISKLAQLGLTPEIIREIIKRSQLARSNATGNHPNNSGGTFAWHEAVCATRDQLGPHGWTKREVSNKALTVNKENSIAIDVSGGTKDTGLEEGFPQTRNPKGKQTKKLVDCNQIQLFEFNDTTEESADDFQTWVLLFYLDQSKQDKEIRYELSLPISMEHDRIVGWSERIIFEPLIVGEVPVTDNAQEYTDDVEVEISIKNE